MGACTVGNFCGEEYSLLPYWSVGFWFNHGNLGFSQEIRRENSLDSQFSVAFKHHFFLGFRNLNFLLSRESLIFSYLFLAGFMKMENTGLTTDQKSGVEHTKDQNGVDQVVLKNSRGASARVSLHGGQVLSWKTDRGEELLFTSSKAIFKPPNAVRGGIQICFPQFGTRGNLEQHGFARNKSWVVEEDPPPLHLNESMGKAFADLLLKPSEDDMKIWPHGFEFRLRVSLAADGSLALISRIRNINCKPFSFSIAYHTYFSISDISEVRVEGLETLDYLDNLHNKERFTEQGDALTFESEVDRVYLSSSDLIAVFDHERKRTFAIRKEGLPDIVVWNPWEKKARSMIDFGDEEYKHMLCVDGAAIEKPITLKPGEEWTGRLEIAVVASC